MPTPDTSLYMIAGYGVIFTMLLGYVLSLVFRFRNAKRAWEMLEAEEKHP